MDAVSVSKLLCSLKTYSITSGAVKQGLGVDGVRNIISIPGLKKELHDLRIRTRSSEQANE